MECPERKIIAVCTSWEDVENLNLVLNRLMAAAEKQGFLPLCVAFDRIGVESRGKESIGEFMNMFRIPNLAGFLLFGEMIRSDVINEWIIRIAAERKLPVFMMERQYEGCINLAFEYGKGFEKVARHMIEHHGCRDVVVVAGIKDNPFSEERIDLCRQLLEEHGAKLPPERVIYGNFWDEPTIRALNEYFEGGGQMPEAFLCINDAMAITVSIYLAEQGIHVPGQVLVSGFDGILPGESHEPAPTTARPDFDLMFRETLDRMRNWNPEDTGKTEVWPIPFEFLARESCGCVPGNLLRTVQKNGVLKIENLDYSRHIRGMGKFILSTLSTVSMERLTACLSRMFAQWTSPFCFAAVLDEQDRETAIPILCGRNGNYQTGGSFRWRESPVPDMEDLLRNPSVRIVLAQLLQNEGETMGYLVSAFSSLKLRDQERFEEQALFLSAALNAVIANRRLDTANQAILQMAEHDYLTGIYNRRGFLRELERRLVLPESRGKILTLFAMDMDRLKYINDVFGHHEGDRAIQSLAVGLKTETEKTGICARYGGDEFAFAFLSDRELGEERNEIRRRIEEKAREVCGNRGYEISASLGAVSHPVKELSSLDEILVEADQALYADKSLRRGKTRVGDRN